MMQDQRLSRTMMEEDRNRLRELTPLLALTGVLLCLAIGIGLGYHIAQGLAWQAESGPVRITWEPEVFRSSRITSPEHPALGVEPSASIGSAQSVDFNESHLMTVDSAMFHDMPDTEVTAAQPWAFGVLDQERRALEGVRVTVWHESNDEVLWQGNTEPNGVVHWLAAPVEPFWVEAEKPGYMRSRAWVGPQDDAAGMVLYPALRVVGQVLDADTNEPISEFKVTRGRVLYEEPVLWDKHESIWIQSSLGRLDVRYDQAAPGLALLVEAPGFVPLESRLLEPSEGRVLMDFRMIAGGGISGRVIDAQNQPVNRAVVCAYCRDEAPLVLHNGDIPEDVTRTTTRRNGVFRLPALHQPQTVLVIAEPGIAVQSIENLDLRDNTIALRPWARVTGQIMRGSRAAGDTLVTISYPQLDVPHRGLTAGHTVKTDRQGRFRIERVIPRGIRIHGKEYFLTPGQHLNIALRERAVEPAIPEPSGD